MTYGSLSELTVTVGGYPVATIDATPDYGAYFFARNTELPCTAASYGYPTSSPDEIRYRCLGYVVSNTTDEVDSGVTNAVTLEIDDQPLFLTWLWGACEKLIHVDVPTNVVVEANGTLFYESGAFWCAEGTNVTLTAWPAAGYDFLCWEGDVPFGQATSNPISFPAGSARRVIPVVRESAAGTMRSFVGGTCRWTDPAGWSPAGVPGPLDDVILASGVCLVSNYAACASLMLGGSAQVNIASVAPKLLEEAALVVGGDVVISNTAILRIGDPKGSDFRHGRLSVGGDFRMFDACACYLGAGPTNETTFTFTDAAGWVTVGGTLALSGSSRLYPRCAPWTGGAMVIRAKRFELGANASVDAVEAGYQAVAGRMPLNLSPGQGYNYTRGAGYGGNGVGYNTEYGKTYGCSNAPVHPGSAKGAQYGSLDRRGGGLIRIHASQAATIAGSLDASANASDTYASSCSGGGIWVTSGGRLKVDAGALLKARGGYKITGVGVPGGGGRIALGAHIADAHIAALAATGDPLAAPRLQERSAEFLTENPSVTVNVASGSGNTSEPYVGTFVFLEGAQRALFLILR